MAWDRGLPLLIEPEPSDLQAILRHLTEDKPRQTTHLLLDTALVTKATLPDGGGHGRRFWVPPGARGLQLLKGGECWCLGDSGPPGPQGGEVHTPLQPGCVPWPLETPWRKEVQSCPVPISAGSRRVLREKAVSWEPEEPILRAEPRRQIFITGGEGEGGGHTSPLSLPPLCSVQGWGRRGAGVAFSWCGQRGRARAQVAGPGPPLTSPSPQPCSGAPFPCPCHVPCQPEPRQPQPRGSGDHAPCTQQTGGHSSSPDCCGDHVPATMLRMGGQRERGEAGEGEDPGGSSRPALAQPLPDTRSRAPALFLAGRGLGKEPEVSKLAGENDAGAAMWGDGGHPGWTAGAGPRPRPGLRAQGNGKRAFLGLSRWKSRRSSLRPRVRRIKQRAARALGHGNGGAGWG